MGYVFPECVDLFRLGEERQKTFPDLVTILQFSLEDILVKEAKFIYFTSVSELVDYLFVKEVKPHLILKIKVEGLDISFHHERDKKKLYSSYLFFSTNFCKEVVKALKDII
jgi:hypothetical protein